MHKNQANENQITSLARAFANAYPVLMGKDLKAAVIILCAGAGRRAGGDAAKQWQPLAGKRVIDWTIAPFATHARIHQIVLVHPPKADADIEMFTQTCICTPGGDTRGASVRRGLLALEGVTPDVVLIHDGARPCVSAALIDHCLDVVEKHGAAAPGVAVTDTLWRADGAKIGATVDRSELFHAQTPQGFWYRDIIQAHDAYKGDATDDVQIAQGFGIDVALVPGDIDNIKITTPEDFARAERILRSR